MAQDHFEKHFKPAGSKAWNFNVTFKDQPAVADLASHYGSALMHPGLYKPIPVEWLHSTILSIGSIDDYSDEEMLAVTKLLEPELAKLKLPKFTFDSWWLWGGNIVLHISPDNEFAKIYDAVEQVLEQVVGPERATKTPHGNFIAHMTLAYTKTHDQEQVINKSLVELPTKTTTFKVTKLDLLKQWSVDGHYEWKTIKTIAIGSITT